MCSQDMKISSPKVGDSMDSELVERQNVANASHALWVLNGPCGLAKEANVAEI